MTPTVQLLIVVVVVVRFFNQDCGKRTVDNTHTTWTTH